jgi:hypothetical protein
LPDRVHFRFELAQTDRIDSAPALHELLGRNGNHGYSGRGLEQAIVHVDALVAVDRAAHPTQARRAQSRGNSSQTDRFAHAGDRERVLDTAEHQVECATAPHERVRQLGSADRCAGGRDGGVVEVGRDWDRPVHGPDDDR